jgi:hypothetical protein
VIASLFKRKGKNEVPLRELELLASMELRWFEPNDARKVLEHAISADLLTETESGLKTTFDYNDIEIPIGFKPSKDLLTDLADDNESLLIQLVNRICITTGEKPQEIIAELNEKQQKTNEFLTLEVLAILYGKSKSVDIDKFIPVVKSKLLSGSD